MIRPLFFIYGICCFAMSLQARQLRDQVEAYVDRVHGSIGFRGAVLVAKDVGLNLIAELPSLEAHRKATNTVDEKERSN
ncbi:MAG: hypothetical protein AAFU85_19950, partial [Planctomycetota bacterium]